MIFFKKNNFDKIKVNFIIAGTQKGGTTALDVYLRKHKDISMALKKEVHFFDTDSYFENKNNIDYSIYHASFDRPPLGKLIGEATPIYMYWHDAPKRMWQYNPEMKIIILLRNPIERAYSHWNMMREKGRDKLSFFEGITNETKRCRDDLPRQHRDFSYVDRGFYLEQLQRIWQFFPKDQTLVIKSEDLKKSIETTLLKVSNFLEIEEFKNIENKTIHARNYVSPMSKDEYEYLKDCYSDEIKKIENILNWDCSDWLKSKYLIK